jgi:hypothetical protein
MYSVTAVRTALPVQDIIDVAFMYVVCHSCDGSLAGHGRHIRYIEMTVYLENRLLYVFDLE